MFGKAVPDVPVLTIDAVAGLRFPDLNIFENSSISACERSMKTALSACQSSDHAHIDNPIDASNSSSQDIRLIWEPGRLQQATWLLIHSSLPSIRPIRSKAKAAAKTMILRWLDANPFGRGLHYMSVMECALRIPVFVLVLRQIDELEPDENQTILNAIYRHAWLISRNLSLYSSLGNHTVAEAVGLVFAGAVYRSTSDGCQWLETGIRLLTDELPHQILADGGPAEQSLGYHRFVLDLYWLAMAFIKMNQLGDVEQWQPRLSAGESFLSAFQDHRGCLPAIGDCDDGVAVAPGISPCRKADDLEKPLIETFRHAGYSVIRNDQIVFTFDHGPLGMAPLYNHGHADALSVTLTKNGRSMLVDPGTFRYNDARRWRKYFKGTQAHNTVTIDDQDQAVQETAFIWSKPYDAKLTAFREEGGKLLYMAVHNGYTRLKSPVTHQRAIFYYDQANFIIKDWFFGEGVHCFQLNFHLHPNATATKSGDGWLVDHDGEQIYVRLLGDNFQVVRGQQNPMLGWFSSKYGHRQPTCCLTFTRTGQVGSIVFTTLICTKQPFFDNDIDVKVGELEGTIGHS